MLYSESEITSDFDKLSLLSEGTPKEKIMGYSLSSPKKKESTYQQNPTQTIDRSQQNLPCGNSSSSSLNSMQRSSVTMLGKGRGKINAQCRNTMGDELYLELEKEIRLATPQGYRNEHIEQHYAHHLKKNVVYEDQSYQPLSPAIREATIGIPANNVALLSLTRNAKKSVKKTSASNGLAMNDKNFPALK